MRARRPADLDEIDRGIIAALREDGRISNREIASLLNVSEGTIRVRIKRLLDDHVIMVTAVEDILAAGYQTTATIGVSVELGQLQPVAEAFAALEEVFWATLTTGTFDFILIVLLRSPDHLLTFIQEKIAPIPGVRRIETAYALKQIKHEAHWGMLNASPRFSHPPDSR